MATFFLVKFARWLMLSCSFQKWSRWEGLMGLTLKISEHFSSPKTSAFHVEVWVLVFKLACLPSTNNSLSVIPYSMIEQWLLNLLSKSKQVESQLWQTERWDENGMKIEQKSCHSTHASGEDTEHWANCCVFNDNCKKKKTTNLIFYL